jgi:RNA polymerase sigma factor (sigma-70 family)
MTPEEVRQSLNDLLEDCRPNLLRFINSRLPSYLQTQVAEEILHDAYHRALLKLWDPEASRDLEWPTRGAFCAWLEKFAENSLADWWKFVTAKKRQRTDLAGGLEESPSKVVRRQEREDKLRTAIRNALTPEEQTAIELRYFQMLPVSAVAALMECPPGQVKNLCWRAKDKLRIALGRSSQFFSS